MVAIVGNPRTGSRTSRLAGTVLDALARHVGVSDDQALLDLADLSADIGAPLGPDADARWATPLSQVSTARLVVAITPIHKGSYTGLLKSFLDLLPGGSLRGAVAVPVTTLGGPGHSLAADLHLRPLLIELGASTPTESLVVTEDRLVRPARDVVAWVDRNARWLTAPLGSGPGEVPALAT
jgi:FMN reductase